MKRRALPCLLLAACTSAAPDGPVTPQPTVQPTTAPTVTPGPELEPDESWRKTPPAPEGEVVFTPPKIEEAKLSNGLRVLVVTRRELPIVDVQLAIPRGADQARPGLAAFAAALLTQGTKSHSALQMSDAVKDLGASLGAWAGYDSTHVTGRALTKKLPKLLDLMAEVVREPLFDKAEIERERASRLTSLAQQRDQPSTLLWNTTLEALYPKGSPYASPLLGSEEAVKKFSRADLEGYWKDTFAPEGAVLAFAGDLSLDEAKSQAERVLGAWKAKAKKRAPVAAPPAPGKDAPRVWLQERAKATQSQVALALVGVPRRTPDFEALLVMNTILGGQFSSRLNMNLREKHAYTYGARSGFDMRLGPGPFTAGGAIESKHTEAAIKEILAEIARIRGAPVTDEELQGAKQNLVKQLPARFESGRETAATLGALAVYDLPLDEFAQRPKKIDAVSAADVQRVAEKHLADASRVVIVVGEPSLAKALEGLGLGKVAVKKAPEPKAEKADEAGPKKK